ncbi:hypothetical protein F0562_028782 [Nyssa sinensis]|uniref:Uncharacterized protein n=1 Tax=Nyssa sinensis TaxID=561372 RepID=A0A5J5B118_9ASTE|nr:hypothetical protein F0562_028782 [Nyssa sinensis]
MNVEEQENGINTTEEIKDGQNTTGLNEGDGEMAKNGIPLIATANEEKVLEIVTSKSEDSSVLNSTLTTDVNNQPDVSTKTDGLTLQNGTEAISDPTRAENATEAITGESSNSSSNLESVVPETVIRSSVSAEAEDNSGSPTTENIDATQNEKSEISNGRDGTNESSNISETENSGEIQHDPINSSDSSIPLEEHEVRIDLDTLPEIRNGVSNNEDAAAE